MERSIHVKYLVYRWHEDTATERKYTELLGAFAAQEDAQLFMFAYQMVHHTADEDLCIGEL